MAFDLNSLECFLELTEGDLTAYKDYPPVYGIGSHQKNCPSVQLKQPSCLLSRWNFISVHQLFVLLHVVLCSVA